MSNKLNVIWDNAVINVVLYAVTLSACALFLCLALFQNNDSLNLFFSAAFFAANLIVNRPYDRAIGKIFIVALGVCLFVLGVLRLISFVSAS